MFLTEQLGLFTRQPCSKLLVAFVLWLLLLFTFGNLRDWGFVFPKSKQTQIPKLHLSARKACYGARQMPLSMSRDDELHFEYLNRCKATFYTTSTMISKLRAAKHIQRHS